MLDRSSVCIVTDSSTVGLFAAVGLLLGAAVDAAALWLGEVLAGVLAAALSKASDAAIRSAAV